MVVRVFLRIIACLVVNFALASVSEAAPRRLVVFAKESALLPDIIQVLSNLKDTANGELLFEITNLNLWFANREDIQMNVDLMRFYETQPKLRTKSNESLKNDKEFLNLLASMESYIKINVLSIGSRLEFQLTITDSLPRVPNTSFTVLLTAKSRFEGFVIDLGADDYFLTLQQSLKKIFPNTNLSPHLVVEVYGCKREDSVCFVGQGRHAIVDLRNSYDQDNPFHRLAFNWSQLNPLDLSIPPKPDRLLSLDPGKPSQDFYFKDTGQFVVEVSCTDKISKPVTKRITFIVKKAPELQIEPEVKLTTFMDYPKGATIPFKVRFAENRPVVKVASAITETSASFAERIRGFTKTSIVNLPDTCIAYEFVDNIVDSTNGEWTGKLYLRNAPSLGGSKTRLRIVVDDGFITSDTAEVSIDNQFKPIVLNFDLLFRRYQGYRSNVESKDSVWSLHAIELRSGWKLNFSKQFSFQLGNIITLDSSSDNAPKNFEAPYFYLGVAYSSLYIYGELTGTYLGWSFGTDIGGYLGMNSFTFEVGHFKRWNSAAIRISFDLPMDWGVVVFSASLVQLYLETD